MTLRIKSGVEKRAAEARILTVEACARNLSRRVAVAAETQHIHRATNRASAARSVTAAKTQARQAPACLASLDSCRHGPKIKSSLRVSPAQQTTRASSNSSRRINGMWRRPALQQRASNRHVAELCGAARPARRAMEAPAEAAPVISLMRLRPSRGGEQAYARRLDIASTNQLRKMQRHRHRNRNRVW